MPPNDRTGPVGVGPAPENTLAVGASDVDLILEQPSDTAPVAVDLHLDGEVTE
jgi:hypothetical protein